MHGEIALVFVDHLENAYDMVPREVVLGTLRHVRVPEAEAGMVESIMRALRP